jgi:hypothetical protein
MKILIKIITILVLAFCLYLSTNAWIDLIDPSDEIKNNSLDFGNSSTQGNTIKDIENVWFSILTTIKVIFQWVLLIYIVYIGAMMVMSMWKNEEDLTKAKTSLWYSLIWLIFINIPWSIYAAFNKERYWTIDWSSWYSSWLKTPGEHDSNIFINAFNFWETINWDIIWFLEVIIISIAIFMFIYTWIRVISSRWNDEEITNAKSRIVWWSMALISVWFIEAFKNFIFGWKIEDWTNIFATLSNLLLFFAWPIAIFFLSLAAYYFITSNGDEEKTKKAKNIITNTVIATIILLASYSFLLDLSVL